MKEKKCPKCGNRFIVKGRAHKYCSKQCWPSNYISKKPQGWISKQEQKRIKSEQAKQRYEDLRSAGYKLASEINVLAGLVSPDGVHQRAKVLEIKAEKCSNGKTPVALFSPEQVEQIIKGTDNPVPEGYMDSNEVAEYLCIAPGTFDVKISEYWSPKHKLIPATIKTDKQFKRIFRKEDIDQWLLDIDEHLEKKRAERKEEKRLRDEAREREEAERKKKIQEKLEVISKTHFSTKEMCGILDKVSIPKKIEEMYKERDGIIKFRGCKYYNKAMLFEIWDLVESQKPRKQGVKYKKENHIEAHIEKVLKKINNGQLPRVKSQKAIDSNLQYIEDYRNGITKTLKCKCCFSPKPFYDFYVRWTVKVGRSTNRCKKCESQREKSPSKPRTHKQRIRYGIVSVIRNDLSKANGKYVANIGVKEIWKALKEKCGYDEDDLMAHLESQFDENMNWDNWLHSKDVTDFGWQIHHIIPRSSLPFKTLKDENFAKCWSLNNLRTLGIKLNQVISDREMMSALNTQFRLGLIDGNVTGIWKHLPYTIEECRNHLESQFDENMSWDNYGTYWQVDHIVPQAYLCFNSFRHRNFAKCWGLENLQPLSASENSSKSSKYEGIRWFYGKDVISEPEKIPGEIF